MKHLFLIIILSIASLLLGFLVNPAFAQYDITITPIPQIIVDKSVSLPNDPSKFVSNILASDPSDKKFKPGQDIFFKIKVKNNSNVTLDNIEVRDIVPEFTDSFQGEGSLDPKAGSFGVITINTGQSAPQQEHIITIKMRIVAQEKLPANETLICRINRVEVSQGRSTGRIDDSAEAQFCIEKQVLAVVVTPTPIQKIVIKEVKQVLAATATPTPIQKIVTEEVKKEKVTDVKKIPVTGPEMNILLLSGEILTLGFGIYLRKKI